MVIGSIVQEQQWAHQMVLATFLGRNTRPIHKYQQHFSSDYGPIQGYLQHFLLESLGQIVAIGSIFSTIMGPSKGIGSIFLLKNWAHSWPSAAHLSSNNGPTNGIGSISWKNHLSHSRPLVLLYFSAEIMGPLSIGSISWKIHLAHSWQSAIVFSSNNGLTQENWQHFLVESLSPFMAIGSIC